MLKCHAVEALKYHAGLMLCISTLLFPIIAQAQIPLLDTSAMRSSVSGQFIVVGAAPDFAAKQSQFATTNAEIVRLQPALLAISAERVKQPLWHALGLDPLSKWRGRIYLALHPASVPDENVSIISTRFDGAWNYRVELPDVLTRAHLVRALTGVVLLEIANRDNAGDRSAEIPAWLTEGFAQQILADNPDLIMSPPDKLVNGLPESRLTVLDRGADTLGNTRTVLREHSALTFGQLSWPDNGQLNGDDGGVYRASAQLFVNQLLALNDGPKNLLTMLQALPGCYNWQTAFDAAFAADFPRPIDLEKWWALQAASFAARDFASRWTPVVSRDQLDTLLHVPVETRATSNSLPTLSAISLQAVIREFKFDRQAIIFAARLRDLQMAAWRMTPQFATFTDAYRRVLADYLGARNGVVSSPLSAPSKRKVADTLKKLDALDAQRRVAENALQSDIPATLPQPSLNAAR